MPSSAILLIPLLPLLGFALLILFGHRMKRETVGILGCAGPFVSFFIGLLGFLALYAGSEPITHQAFHWIGGPHSKVGISIDLGLVLDRLSSVMVLVVAGVGSLIHLYSIGYMAGDRKFHRYFAYLNLFTGMMLILVLGSSLPLLFVGWEGVGLCSYLLIGFWHREMENAEAAQKAFIVNRIGDAAFLIGMFILYSELGTLSFTGIEAAVPSGDPAMLGLAALCLFVGATGKSAQIPLYVWLPDAMAGPTPVSALIHAATMVTSGIYLLARLHPLYELSPAVVGNLIAVIGAMTALLAATIALAQTDIKKVLAYSTVSQLGYMFIAMGFGAVHVGMFHLVSHAFFKALLFLGAGSVIVALHHEQDMRKMGGLRKPLGSTCFAFWVGGAGLAGLPITTAFFSKDAIIGTVFLEYAHTSNPAALFSGILAMGAAFLTALYTFRMIGLTFYGAPGEWESADHDVEEPGGTMGAVLGILSIFAFAGGLLLLPSILAPEEAQLLRVWLEIPFEDWIHHYHGLEIGLFVGTIVLAVLGSVLGFAIFRRPAPDPTENDEELEEMVQEATGTEKDDEAAEEAEEEEEEEAEEEEEETEESDEKEPVGVGSEFISLAREGWGIDRFYRATIVEPLRWVSEKAYRAVDAPIIDGAVLGVTVVARAVGRAASALHSGLLRRAAGATYAGIVTVIVGAVVAFLVLR